MLMTEKMVKFRMETGTKDIVNSGRRDRVEIIAAVIALTQKPKPMNQIMDQSKLPYGRSVEYLKFMIETRLIEKRVMAKTAKRTTYVYRATEKGLLFLKTYCDILRLLYGEDFMKNRNKLAVACLQLCKES